MTGVKSKLPTKPPSLVKKIDVSNFNDVVLVCIAPSLASPIFWLLVLISV
jgi:hypothetical protein